MRGPICAAVVALAVAAPATAEPSPGPAAAVVAQDPAFVPTVGLGFGGLAERLEVALDGQRAAERRADVRLALALGLSHPIHVVTARQRLEGHASLGLGPTFTAGRYQLQVREDATWSWAATPWLVVRAGLGAGVTLDLSRSAMSQAELGVPLSVLVLDAFELVYRPYVAVPLGSDDRMVFEGSRRQSADPALVPLDLTLRFHVRALGF